MIRIGIQSLLDHFCFVFCHVAQSVSQSLQKHFDDNEVDIVSVCVGCFMTPNNYYWHLAVM